MRSKHKQITQGLWLKLWHEWKQPICIQYDCFVALACLCLTFSETGLSLMCHCRSQHPRRSRGGPSRPPAYAFRQHAAGRRSGRTGERWWICGCCSCCCGLGRGGRQLHRTFWLQSQTHTDQTDLSHRAGEIRTGKNESPKLLQNWAFTWNLAVVFCSFRKQNNALNCFFLYNWKFYTPLWLPQVPVELYSVVRIASLGAACALQRAFQLKWWERMAWKINLSITYCVDGYRDPEHCACHRC